MKCLNCHSTTSGAYCSSCGQKTATKRLSLAHLVNDFLLAVLNTEKGLLRTIIDLFKDSTLMVQNYMAGYRASYMSAGKYTLLMIVAFTLTLSLLENRFSMFETLTNMASFKVTSTHDGKPSEQMQFSLKTPPPPPPKVSGKISKMGKTESSVDFVEKANQKTSGKGEKKNTLVIEDQSIHLSLPAWGDTKAFDKDVKVSALQKYVVSLIPTYHRLFFDYLRVLGIFWIPIFTLFTCLFFRKAKMNIAEHLTLNSYLFAHGLLIFVLLSPLFWIFPNENFATLSLCSLSAFLYVFLSIWSFFKKESRSLVKATSAVTLGLSTYSVFLLASAVALALIIAAENIQKLQ